MQQGQPQPGAPAPAPPPPPAAFVSGLTLEAYLQLHGALTKGQGESVQAVTPIEECYYKIGDLRQLLQLHGLTAGKFNRAELLAAIKGQKLINPCSTSASSNANAAAATAPRQDGPQEAVGNPPQLPFTAADALSAVLGVSLPAASGMRAAAQPPVRFIQLQGSAGGPDEAVDPQQTTEASGTSSAAAAAALPAPAPAPTAAATVESMDASAGGARQTQQTTLPQANPPPAPGGQQHPSVPCQQRQTQPQPQQQQQQQPIAAQGPLPTTQHQQQQHTDQQNTGAPDPLHQLLSTLLNQHPAALPATTAAPTQTQPQPAATGTTPPTAVELLQQLLAQTAAAAAAAAAAANGTQSTSVLPAAPPTAPQAAPTVTAAAPAPPAVAPQAAPEAAQAAVATATTSPCLADMPQLPHTPWLKAQLQWFAANGLRVAQRSQQAGGGDSSEEEGSLLGCRAGFVLLEQLQVAGPKNVILTLPPGFYEGMAVKYLGSECNLDVCDYQCPGQHQFYRARILPPRAVPEPEAPTTAPHTNPDSGTTTDGGGNSASTSSSLRESLVQAEAAASGRPVLLILDLHSQLRVHSLEEMMGIQTPEQLQDAWVLLEHEEQPAGSEEEHQPTCCGNPSESAQAPAPAPAAAAAAAAGAKRGRKPGRPAGAHKRSKA